MGAASVSHAARIQAQTDDLRQLITLPPMHFTVNVVASRGQLRWRQDLGTPEEIAKLQKELRGDSTDAQQLLQLGRLFEDAGRTNQAALAYSNAVTAFRQQVENQPKDGKLLAGLGEALANISQRLEAETVLRRAVTVSPRDRACWTQLGLFLSDSSHFVLYPEKTPQDLMESPALLATKYKPSAAQFERAEKLSRESMECFDRAISLAPKDALGFQARACGLSTVSACPICAGPPNSTRKTLNCWLPWPSRK
jgi:tetratricopeptide (TPR) repeat protein